MQSSLQPTFPLEVMFDAQSRTIEIILKMIICALVFVVKVGMTHAKQKILSNHSRNFCDELKNYFVAWTYPNLNCILFCSNQFGLKMQINAEGIIVAVWIGLDCQVERTKLKLKHTQNNSEIYHTQVFSDAVYCKFIQMLKVKKNEM